MINYAKFLRKITKHSILLFLFPFSLYTFPSTPTIVISEVMSNPYDEERCEFIELFNATTYQIDILNYAFTDGGAVDFIVPWNLKGLKDVDVTINTTVLNPKSYAVILDREYVNSEQPYNFPPNILIVTTMDNDLGDGLATTDPVTLLCPGELSPDYVIDTYGTPKIKSDTYPRDWDDDGSDGIPFNPGSNISAERIHYGDVLEYKPDSEMNWKASKSITGSTPGYINSVVLKPVEIMREILELKNVVFFPHGDLPEKPTYLTITYNLPSYFLGVNLTMKIFNINGELVKDLINQEKALVKSETINWDGKDNDGKIPSPGVYICYLECVDIYSGKVHKSQKLFVLGCSLK